MVLARGSSARLNGVSSTVFQFHPVGSFGIGYATLDLNWT
jgi:hypothetical protein